MAGTGPFIPDTEKAAPEKSGQPAATHASAKSQPRPLSRLGIALNRAELERIVLLSGLLFLSALLLVVGRTARDALFLTRFPVTWIAPMWMAVGAVSALVALGYERAVRRLPRARFGTAFALFAAATYVVLRVLIGYDVEPAYFVFAIWSEIIANLTAMLSWTIAQDLYDARSAKRAFGWIGAGRITGTIASGLAAGAVAPIIGTENLIFVLVAALLAVALLCRVTAARHGILPSNRPDERAKPRAEARSSPLQSRYVTAIGGTIFVLFTMLTIGDYQFKAIALSTFPTRDSLAAFMGTFYGAVGFVGLFVQFVVTPRILKRWGVIGAAVALPIAFLMSSILLVAVPSMFTASILKASDHALQFSIFDVALQLLLFPFPTAERERVRTLSVAIMKPLGYGVGALLLVIFAASGPAVEAGPDLIAAAAHLGYISLPLGLILVPMLRDIRRGYVDAMRGTLVRGSLTDDSPAEQGRLDRALSEALMSTDAPRVLFAMDRLRQLDPDRVRDALPTLTRHASSRVRAAALRASWTLSPDDAADLSRERIDDEDAEVRGLAVETLARTLGEDAHDELSALASRQDDAVRAAAIGALLRYGGLDGMLDGAPRLRTLLESRDARDRIVAAQTLGLVGQTSLERALVRLLGDEDQRVRQAALVAAATTATPRLLPRLVEALDHRALRRSATNAIVAMGSRAVSHLSMTLADTETIPTVRLAVPRILWRIGTTAALSALLDHIDEPDDRVRQKILASASRLRLALGAPPAPLGPIRERIEREAVAHERERDLYIRVRPAVAMPLLDDHVIRRMRKGLIRILRLCELVYPREVVAGVRAHVFGSNPALRANAFEVLESLLDRRQGARLIALFDRYLELTNAFPQSTEPPTSADVVEFVRLELASDDPFRAALALDAVAVKRIEACGELTLGALSDRDPLVREAAAIAAVELEPEGAAAALERLLEDPDPIVAYWANYWKRTGQSGLEAGDGMYTTIEKVLFLQRVPILSRISGEELVGLARTAEVLTFRRGDVIYRQGDPGGALYFVISGTVGLSVDGKEMARRGANEVFGEASVLDRAPRVVTATALEPVELLRVSSEDFIAAAQDTVEIAMGVLQVLSRKLREADRRLSRAEDEVSKLRALTKELEHAADPAESKHSSRIWNDEE
ncbi:MAG: HEAT repeat domain-containing protein [Polyangiaceae bacterium]|nr:HEAT repeat domain-containing protein [Polyangiaceae bacterium]